ncbi:hypothetical protein PCANC_22989 [Puccinia coronata f. sp. avenae]|uniref:Uncharacterized protein n=1 Tax=Puccinia coronata f. sp. avenae TaxID=200324 RepID=A0A2N5U5Q8_9BASI|nr:hypothetical protein PCANC_22989 [Puccinia coronata f. sp. avenae]
MNRLDLEAALPPPPHPAAATQSDEDDCKAAPGSIPAWAQAGVLGWESLLVI